MYQFITLHAEKPVSKSTGDTKSGGIYLLLIQSHLFIRWPEKSYVGNYIHADFRRPTVVSLLKFTCHKLLVRAISSSSTFRRDLKASILSSNTHCNFNACVCVIHTVFTLLRV